MSSPLNVNPGDVEVTASSLQELKADLGGSIPAGVDVTVYPTGAATAVIHGNAAAATMAMQAAVAGNAGKLHATAGQYDGVDKQNAGQLGKKDGDAGLDLAKTVSPFLAPAAQLLGQASQAIGNFGGNALQAALYFTSGYAGQVSNHKETPAPAGSANPEYHEANEESTTTPATSSPAASPHGGHHSERAR